MKWHGAKLSISHSISQWVEKRERKREKDSDWEEKPKKLIIYSRRNAYHADLAISLMLKGQTTTTETATKTNHKSA